MRFWYSLANKIISTRFIPCLRAKDTRQISHDKHLLGFLEEAAGIRDKYLEIVERNFAETGNIYEKYDAITGGISSYEYPSPVMMVGLRQFTKIS